MTTPAIEQLYATHCTLATASQHRTTGPRGEEVFEYSARSASVPGNRAHELFQCVEMSVKFALPSDAPSSKKLEYTAENCPWRRLSYFPNLSGKRSASHSVYRQKDTRGRPGSYFAHALLTPNREESDAFGPLDVLQLWKSPEWVLQDDASLPHDLPPPKPLAEWTGFRQYINESVLIAFLTQPAGGDFSCCVDDAFDSAIPARWRDIPVEQRQRLLVDLLACALYTRGARRDPVWVVVEPGLAALLFFGVFRLLPKTKLIDALSFSTFQSHNDPTAPALAACSFFDPATGDLPPEAYRGAIINTYNARRGQLLKSIPTETAQILVDRWIAGDEARGALSELRKAARQWSIDTAADLESFLKVDPLVERLVSTEPIVPIATEEIPRTPGPRGYLIARLVERLKKSNTATRVAANLGQDSQRLFRIMELLLDENADAAAHELGQTFCKKLPADLLPPLLANAEISESIRVAALVDFTKKEGTVPSQVDLWVARLPAGYPKTLPRLVLEQVNPTVQCQILRLALDDPKALAPSEIDLARLRLAATVGRDAKVNPRELHEALWRPIPDRATQLNCVRDPEIHAALVAQLPSDDETLRGLAESILNKLHSDTVWPTGEWNALRRIAAFVPADRRWEFDSSEKLDRLSKELGDDLNVPASVLPWKAKQAREAAVEGAVKRLIAWVHETYGELGFLRNGEGDSIEDYDGTAHADFVLRP
ncbi:MAG: hypothetical protein NT069_12905, partial [Planctomycetota bacterium]|nr:hypothetical protein [Planctomycetota bacterium]